MKKTSALGLLLLGTAGIAFAQTTAPIPPTVGASPRANRGAPTREMSIRAAVDASYDSNAFGLSDAAIARGIGNRSKDDFRITPSLLLDIFQPFGRQSAFLRGSIGYDFYTKNSQLNRARIGLNGGANVAVLNNCSVTPSANYQRQRSNAGDIFAISPVPVVDRVNTEEQFSYGVDAQCAGAIGISPTFGYRHSQIRNTSSFYELNDSNQDSFNASLGYQRPSLGRISVYGSYSEGEYIHRNVLGLPNVIPGIPLDGVKSYSAGGRFERDIGSRMSGSISVGFSWVDPKAVFSRKFRGSTYALALAIRPSDRFSVNVDASRSADLSNTVFATFALTQIYSLNGTYRLNRKMAVNFGSSYQKRDYRQNAQAVDNAGVVKNDEFIRAYGGLVYDLNRRLRLNGLISQQRRKSDNAFFNYNNTTVSLGLSFALGR
ncbi:MAG: outer membrane beta-barrel protein [Proteobacteria bacterium]|nr:outer membrane beta-barrel protein [Pseudomonadota bacterium]